MEAFEKLHRSDSKVPIILMTGRGTAGTAIEAMQRGAFEYILKPFNLSTLLPLIEDAAVTTAVNTATDSTGNINVVDLTLDRLASASEDILRELVSMVEKEIFTTVLKHTSGNLTQAARHLGFTRTTLRARLDLLGMSLEKTANVS